MSSTVYAQRCGEFVIHTLPVDVEDELRTRCGLCVEHGSWGLYDRLAPQYREHVCKECKP